MLRVYDAWLALGSAPFSLDSSCSTAFYSIGNPSVVAELELGAIFFYARRTLNAMFDEESYTSG